MSGSAPPSSLTRKAVKGAEIVYYGALVAASGVFGFKPRHRARDRRILDERILPALAKNDRFHRVLNVGCDWYTQHVEDLFAAHGREYTTLEIDPARARYGAKRHVVAPLSRLGDHFAPGSLDLILCNGVIGWGLDQPAEIEASMAACVTALAPGGVLLLGWDDVPEKLPVAIRDIRALQSLSLASPVDDLPATIATETYARHTFGFFVKGTPV
jgi:hypothetical protein